MIRWTPWTVGVGELAALPPAQSAGMLRRVRALERHAGFWISLALLLAAAQFAALVPVLFDHEPPPPGSDVVFRLMGGSFGACGLIAWRRRPDSRVGPLLTAAGFGIFVYPLLSQIDAPLAFTAAALFNSTWTIAYVALLLTFLTGGRLESRVDRWLVAVFAIAIQGIPFAALPFAEHPDNLLFVHADRGVFEAFLDLQRALAAAASIGIVVVLVARWLAASAPRRRALLPGVAGVVSALLYAFLLSRTLVSGKESPEWLAWLLNASLVLVPAAFLAGLLRSRLARGALTQLFGELRTMRGPRLQEALAHTLGDPSLEVVYGDRPPRPGEGRAVAAIERDGRRVAALVYDESLDEDPELVDAARDAAAIAIENEQLQAESHARQAELRASRERLVAAGDEERRRLERNLHDGAQQRLVAVSLQLRMIESRIRDDPAAVQLAASARDELAQSLEELRELARGIHPAVLRHGLPAALDSLAARSTVPTTVTCDAEEALPEQVELAAYFVASEALANVAKYARATVASVTVSCAGGHAVVQIADDGVGGAQVDGGTGLRGLADRVEALDGRLSVTSPPGAGTVVTAELPCAS